MRCTYVPCIPTAGKAVPARPEWLHEVKYDGYRLLVIREDKRVRLVTRNGHDWSDRFPWIVESALKTGRSTLSSVASRDPWCRCVSDFNALHSRKHDHEVYFCAFDILIEGNDDLRQLRLNLRRTFERRRRVIKRRKHRLVR